MGKEPVVISRDSMEILCQNDSRSGAYRQGSKEDNYQTIGGTHTHTDR
jgi:hypothetical protein